MVKFNELLPKIAWGIVHVGSHKNPKMKQLVLDSGIVINLIKLCLEGCRKYIVQTIRLIGELLVNDIDNSFEEEILKFGVIKLFSEFLQDVNSKQIVHESTWAISNFSFKIKTLDFISCTRNHVQVVACKC